MSIGEICNREVVVIDRDSTVMTAAKLMRTQHVGTLVVVEKSSHRGKVKPVGILTDRDIVIEVIAEEVDLNAITVGDVMSYELVTAKETDGIWDILQRMRVKGIRRIPVVNEAGELEGILAVDDLLELLAEEITDLSRLIKREHQYEQELRV